LRFTQFRREDKKVYSKSIELIKNRFAPFFYNSSQAFGRRHFMITFVPFDEFHIPPMLGWLSDGEALRWNGDDGTTEGELRHKYLVEKPRGGTHSYVIQYDGEPIGHVQYYRVIDYPEWCSMVSGESGDYGLDLFIGRNDLVGQGIGTRVVRNALSEPLPSHSSLRFTFPRPFRA